MSNHITIGTGHEKVRLTLKRRPQGKDWPEGPVLNIRKVLPNGRLAPGPDVPIHSPADALGFLTAVAELFREEFG